MPYDIVEVEITFDELKTRSLKSIGALKSEFLTMRAGRANPHLLDKVLVSYYGTLTPLNQIANISVPEARLLVVNVYDTSALKNVEKAIIDANLGIFPSNDGKVIRMVFPELNEERRKALVKEIKTLAENAKVALRNIRRDAVEAVRAFKKDSIVTEDQLKTYEKDIDKETANYIADIDRITSDKEKEILSV
ncbi:MAG: ribosome recycling factor [Firmicutes bacterium]|nr:ribosome recycling factor [Bacillota bacterium]